MKPERMSWAQLLDDTRIRKAIEGTDSVKAEDESRSEFERDRDRTVYSNPVRRLIGKTQVFPLNPNDHVRTRLIHSLEVSTVAEGLASQVVREIHKTREDLSEKQQRAIAKIAETCGLLHDLGNPPFGHAGELAIASWFDEKKQREERIEKETDRFFYPLGRPESQRAKDFLHFEGNAQTLRIIANTNLLGHDHGLNLTCATTAAARKYLASSLTAVRRGPNHAYAKPGYFTSEAEVFALVSQRTGTVGRRHPITYLAEAADDIVYSVVDIEDAIEKRILRWRDVKEYLDDRCNDSGLYARVMDRVNTQLGGTNQSDNASGQSFRVNAISEFVIATVKVFTHRYDEIMLGQYTRELVQDESYEGNAVIAACKELLREKVFQQKEVLRLEVRGRRVIHDLMCLFWEGVSEYLATRKTTTGTYAGKLYLLIAESYRQLFERRLNADPDNGTYLGLQLVTDYVSGMTDGFACRLHEELVNG